MTVCTQLDALQKSSHHVPINDNLRKKCSRRALINDKLQEQSSHLVLINDNLRQQASHHVLMNQSTPDAVSVQTSYHTRGDFQQSE